MPQHSLSPATWRRLKQEMDAEEMNLSEMPWEFETGPVASAGEEPLESEREISSWSTIRVGRHWESEGHAALDGWASYRVKVKVPAGWKGRPIFLTFTGVDDVYELDINGKLFARRGDIASRQSTFDEIFSHDLTGTARAGEPLEICVRVYDWFGAGGIFRPVYLGTSAHRAEGPILSRGE